jgi:hypothetical protein
VKEVVDPVDVLVREAGQVQHRLAHGFARNGAGVDADAADPVHFFDNGDELAELGPWIAARCPAGPDPITIRSYDCMRKDSIVRDFTTIK